MFLKRIELIGFKSFAEKTVLEFLPNCEVKEGDNRCGVTAVVGPNGSGKSNIADAIRWVMGEQSPKSLRGKKSYDVIFSGSNGRSQLNFAQVTLHFDNADKRIPIDYTEVVVSRKIYRSGEGEYYINDSKVRLLDVIDLLAKAGIGKESHCVLTQGMSDATLNSAPLDRRSIIEEAAGVKPFQIKRDRSLRKLETTRDNLERTREIIDEIEPRLRILKRQAKKAQQREEVENELKSYQTLYYGFSWKQIQEEKEQSVQNKDVLGREVMMITRKMDTLIEKRKEKSEKLQDTSASKKFEQELVRERSFLSQVEREHAMIEGKLEIEKEREKNQKLIEIIPVDLQFVRGRISDIRTRQQSLIQNIASVENLKTLGKLKEEANRITESLQKLHEDCGKATVEVERESDIINQEREAFRTRIKGLEEKRDEIQKKIHNQKEKVERLEKSILENSNDKKALNEEFFQIEREIHELQRQLDQLKDRHNEAKIVLARVEVREEDLLQEIQREMQVEPQNIGYKDEDIDREEMETKVLRLKSKLAQIGGIDPSIIEEYEETQERYNFLTKETEDLEGAIESLEKIAVEMDERINKEFSHAFKDINKEFGRFFEMIFDGGSAELVKVKVEKKIRQNEDLAGEKNEEDSDDEVEQEQKKKEKNISYDIGIDIKVAPPKKKIYNLSMLSGGERSLVSLALLFAIISYNPPPFAVLDEVEAALDEANSRRFSLLLKELSKQTQFVVVTHNRETMKEANLLYGVTMNNNGVSKLLSIKLDEYTEKK